MAVALQQYHIIVEICIEVNDVRRKILKKQEEKNPLE